MIELLTKYKSLISYAFFGVCTTVINLVAYYLCSHILSLTTVVSTVIAWIVAAIFAYVTNKLWVFECKSWEKQVLIKEIPSFFACRILTGVLDIAIMAIFVDVLHFNDMLMKIISNVLVIILNYIASKFLIFKRSN